MIYVRDYNKPFVDKVYSELSNFGQCCYVAGTGSGKSFITMAMLEKHKLNALIICPTVQLRNEWVDMSKKYDCHYINGVVTYSMFSKHYKELGGYDIYVFDEAHKMATPIWGKSIRDFRNNLMNNEYVLGLTATEIRYFDKGRPSISNTVFDNHVVYGPTNADMIKKNLVSNINYICALFDNNGKLFSKYYNYKGITEELKGKLDILKNENRSYIKDVILKSIDLNNIKTIAFSSRIEDIAIIKDLMDYVFNGKLPIYIINSKMTKEDNALNLQSFKECKNGIIISINMLNEGLHIPGVNSIFMFRKTVSPTIYTQQIGRVFRKSHEDSFVFDFVSNTNSVKKTLSKSTDTSINTRSNVSKMLLGNEKYSDQIIVNDYTSGILKIIEELQNAKSWSEEEIVILKEWYPKIGLKCIKYLPGRTKGSIANMSHRLNIKAPNYSWSEEEISILKEWYPKIGLKCIKYLPGRSKGSINIMATKLNIKRISYYGSWSEEEISILKEWYPKIGYKCYKYLPGRTKSTISTIASELNIKAPNYSWSEEEIVILKEWYPKIGIECAKYLPGRSKGSVANMAHKLNIKAPNYSWSEEEISILKEWYPKIGIECAKYLPGRSKYSINGMAARLNIKSSYHYWSEEEISIIKEWYPKIGTMCVKYLPRRNKKSIIHMAHILNIKIIKD